MRTKKSLKVLVLALAVVMVFAVCSTAFAAHDHYIPGKYVYGGASQWQWEERRSEPNSMDVSVTHVTWNNQSDWKFRGYRGTSAATVPRAIYGLGTYTASYTAGGIGENYSMYMSIASSNPSNNLLYAAFLYF